MSTITYDTNIRHVKKWAQANELIQAVVIVGSRPRTQVTFDSFSDLDFIIFTPEVERLTLSDGWKSELGQIWMTPGHMRVDIFGESKSVRLPGGGDPISGF